MITQETIDEIFAVARVEEVIGEFVRLKKSGRNFKALSPFSDEKTPSFVVSPAKQIWKDFSSGKGGNAVTFLMAHEHYSYPEALRYLAEKYGVEIRAERQTPERAQRTSERESLYIITDFAKGYFQKVLTENPKGKAIGLGYCKERGFSRATIEEFELGYCSDEWDAFTVAALAGGYRLEFLAQTGLTIIRENGAHLDRFRGRLLFPIHSFSGRTLGFGGRILKSDEKLAKYINSPQSAIYHKSEILYGIFQSKREIIKQDNCYLVEGYTDVISLHQNGVKNAVASLGTSLTVAQIRLIRRLTQNVTILFDGDTAGIKAALRSLDLVLEQGMNARVLLFPEGQDPDAFARSCSTDALRDFLQRESEDFIQFKARLNAAEAQGDPLRKAEAIGDVVRSIAKIDDLIKREMYIRETASIFQISEQVLFSQLHRSLQKNRREAEKQQKRKTFEVVRPETLEMPSQEGTLERALLRAMLLYGAEEIAIKVPGETASYETTVAEEAIQLLVEDAMTLQHPVLRKIFEEIRQHWESQNELLSGAHFTAHPDPEVAAMASSLLVEEHPLHDWDRMGVRVAQPGTRLSRALLDTIFRYKRRFLEKQLKALAQGLKTQEEPQKTAAIREIMNIKRLMATLDQFLTRVV
ncbi:MAG: DNA primase [Flavobacteriales bacterium]